MQACPPREACARAGWAGPRLPPRTCREKADLSQELPSLPRSSRRPRERVSQASSQRRSPRGGGGGGGEGGGRWLFPPAAPWKRRPELGCLPAVPTTAWRFLCSPSLRTGTPFSVCTQAPLPDKQCCPCWVPLASFTSVSSSLPREAVNVSFSELSRRGSLSLSD